MSKDLFVYAERVGVPTMLGSKPVVVLIRNASGEVIYKRSAARLIDIWLFKSLGLGALVSFPIAGIAYPFIEKKLQQGDLGIKSRSRQ